MIEWLRASVSRLQGLILLWEIGGDQERKGKKSRVQVKVLQAEGVHACF